MQERNTHWLYPLNVQNDFHFNSCARDFIVEEIPLYPFSGEGEHLVLKIRKKDMTTWEMLDALASHLGIKKREIGYAGLKDKNAMTVQHISILKKYQERLESFEHPQIKILESYVHNNKIRLGHLKGNRFFIRLKKVLGVQKDKIQSTLKWISTYGVPNYFGVQRFGNSGENWKEGKEILEGTFKVRDKTKREFLINAYQSYLFNDWLSKRIELSLLLEKFSENEVEQIVGVQKGDLSDTKKQPHFFKLLKGELMMHYPYGRVFELEDLHSEAKRFMERDIAPTGLLSGQKTALSSGIANHFEALFDRQLQTQGSRRYAWIFIDEIEGKYIEEKAHFELSFVLPKGSYATNVLDVLRGR
ncbi:MAG: tRNA pseudouridine(13) synthase TruD [Campylobacterales bacterium]|nr:tRNA pseudouridine(13) synthase TruD [Campylobacterales bacterium]